MTKTSRKAPKGKTSASTAQKADAPATPSTPKPDDWCQQTAFGFMRFDGTPAGRLVRLADVLRWLESSMELPRAAALDALCGRLPGDGSPWCYLLHPTDYARLLPLDFMYWFHTPELIAAAKAASERAAMLRAERGNWATRWDGASPAHQAPVRRISSTAPETAEPGRPALVKLLRRWWAVAKLRKDSTCDVLDDPKAARPNSLAIRLDKAGELWGYGAVVQSSSASAQPSTWGELVAARKLRPGGAWTPEGLALLAAEKDKRGAGAVASIAAELGVTAEAVNGALRRSRKRQPAGRTGQVVRIAGGGT